MEYFTELIGKQVISVFDRTIVGTMFNFEIDWQKKRVRNLIILSTDEETFFVLKPQRVFSIDDCIIIRNIADLVISAEPNFAKNIGSLVYGISGKLFGKVNEIAFENWQPQILYANETIDFSKILIFADNFILINDSEKILNLNNFRPKKIVIPAGSTQTVSILDSISSVSTPKIITANPAKI